MLTRQGFLGAGYKQAPVGLLHEYASSFMQRRVVLENGKTAYFINVYEYTTRQGVSQFDVEVQMHRGGFTFDITIHHNQQTTVQELEGIVSELWVRFGFEADKNNN